MLSAMICARLDLDTRDVLETAATKWNFLPFSPGLVGGHCVDVDPYYLTDRAERAGYHPEVILSGRRINDGMGLWIARETIKRLLRNGGGRNIAVLGVTFEEKRAGLPQYPGRDIVRELRAFGADVEISDPLADADPLAAEFDLRLVSARTAAGE